jgi:hypothetical protein
MVGPPISDHRGYACNGPHGNEVSARLSRLDARLFAGLSTRREWRTFAWPHRLDLC